MARGSVGKMLTKWIGSILIIIASGGFGIMIAVNYKREISVLKQLISALDYMECELQFRMYALPELCRLTANECDGVIRHVFSKLAIELEDQISPDVASCLRTVLTQVPNIPQQTMECFRYLGDCLGRFDLNGQLKGLETVRQECRTKLSKLSANSDIRARSYQTIGLCAGAAIVILLI